MGSLVKTFKLPIKGMHCTKCEERLTKIAQSVPGVDDAKASFANNNLRLIVDEAVFNEKELQARLQKADYDIAKESHATSIWVAVVGLVFISVYLIVGSQFGFSFVPQFDARVGYGILFITGILTSFHCIAMCGGLCISQSISKQDTKSSIRATALYNIGRIISYTLVGALAGALGSMISFSGAAKGIVAILSGLFMILLGLGMTGWVPFLTSVNAKVSGVFHSPSSNKPFGSLGVGLANGLMPCGPLQAMQIYAVGTGDPLTGALSMFFFALGTSMLMMTLGTLSGFMSQSWGKKMQQVGAVLVVVLGVLMFQRGFALSGFNVGFGGGSELTVVDPNSAVQEVKIEVQPKDYEDVVVQKGKPVELHFNVSEENLNGCNSAINIPAFDIEQNLAVGDNVVTFTPEEAGTYSYSCWMGMIHNEITVVE